MAIVEDQTKVEPAETSASADPPDAKDSPRSTVSMMLQSVGENLLPVGAAVAVLALWQVMVPILEVPTYILPTPLEILERMVTERGRLFEHTLVTLTEVLYGFGLTLVVGIPLSLAIFYWRLFEKVAYPFMVTLQTVPKVALAPLLVLWFGHALAPKVLVAFLISFFPVVISTVVGLRSLDKDMVGLVRSMGANEWQTFTKLRLPAALPNVFGGLKVGIGLAVVGAIIGEYVASSSGLGYLQLTATAQLDTVLNFAALTTISMMGITLFFIVNMLEKLMIPWHGRQLAD